MTSLAVLIPVLAVKEDAIVAVVVFVITVIGWIMKLAGNKAQKGPPVANRPRPPVRPRDDKLQQEISIFMEDNAGRRNTGVPSRPSPAASRPQPQNSAQAKRRSSVGAAPTSKKKKSRPGEEIASRQAPVAQNLGTAVKQSLSQHMTDRVNQDAQQRLAPRAEEQVGLDLGNSVTGGSARPSLATPPRPVESPRADRFAELLRSPDGVQQAIVLNLILSPPPGRAGSHRR
ncbi:MAG TPA: hypothetical protein VGM05_06975 [Planctomycetaceae bacterium]|jgi:hypothetical protein